MNVKKHHEKSCGAVVYTVAQQGVVYLLVHENNGFWSFPKGHMEPGETEMETAAREIREETGLSVQFVEGFRVTDEHTLAREGHPERLKTTVYFLAEYHQQMFHPQETEISSIALMDYDSAMAAFQQEGFKRVLTQADAFLHHS